MKKSRLAIFASGDGTNAEAIMKHFRDHQHIEVVLVLTNNPDAFVLTRSENLSIPAFVFNRQQFRESDEVLLRLMAHEVTHIVLAGFLWLIPPNILRQFSGKIINIHPALLPRHGGKGMYGMKVHEAVKANGDLESGISIHVVNEAYDEGRILFQEKCPIADSDSPEDIAQKVHALEHQYYPRVIEQWVTRAAT